MLRCAILAFTVLGGNDSAAADDLVHLTDSNFEHETQASTGMTTGDWFVMFHAPWCGHCKTAMPEVVKFAKNARGKTNVAAVDATAHQTVGKRFGVNGFPTFLFFSHSKQYKYGGARSAAAFEAFVTEGYKNAEGSAVAEPVSFFIATVNEIVGELKSLFRTHLIAAIIVLLVGFSAGALLSFFIITACDRYMTSAVKPAPASDNTKKTD
eukprot:GEMP01073925.1.p1 GENE.GEMP01073925.1~~GEMP01073925.1.p1  ORF type:complete len:210 (+),score=56.80 GEMP01073925.1:60-689(+)